MALDMEIDGAPTKKDMLGYDSCSEQGSVQKHWFLFHQSEETPEQKFTESLKFKFLKENRVGIVTRFDSTYHQGRGFGLTANWSVILDYN